METLWLQLAQCSSNVNVNNLKLQAERRHFILSVTVSSQMFCNTLMELISQIGFLITVVNNLSLGFKANLLAVTLTHVTAANLSQSTSGSLHLK